MAKTNFTDIFKAAAHGTVEDVRYFVEKEGIDVNAKAEDSNTPLSIAALGGNLAVVEFLVSKGADVNAKNNDKYTPLHTTFFKKNLAVAEFLISKGADVNAKASDGNTLLHWAADENILKIAEFLVSKGADVNAKNYKGSTPLLIAAGADSLNVAKLLVSKGADVNAKNNQGYTPLNYAKSMSTVEDYLKSVGGVETEVNKPSGSGGCYIATAVYNSYDAPEVLCLRRFRDEVLSSSILGRLLITLYYRFSPSVAEKLKRTRLINTAVRKALDKIVRRLNQNFHQQDKEGEI